MATLPLTSLALVSTQRTVPLNGSPTSQDYNDDQNDGLIDLTSIVSFMVSSFQSSFACSTP